MNLLFDIFLEIKEIEEMPIIKREAVRGIIVQNNKIMMMASNEGDYKLPGGGIKKGETHIEALKREINEETGFNCNSISRQIGRVFERKIDIYDESSIFEMTSYYYICKLDNYKGKQNLTESEMNLGLTPIYVGLEEAIKANYGLIYKYPKRVVWTRRENIVLSKILQHKKEIEKINLAIK